ncbi:MAG: carbohydrate kinase [Treponema sp.]|jgi:xylulokinase|nr:carbohydrate kinase [Treponema sp.]
MAEQYIIGIDCGTTSVKALAYDEQGNEICAVDRGNEVISSGVCNEQDMEKLWQNVTWCVKTLMQKSGLNPAAICGMGVSGQGEGLWAIDSAGRPVRNAILWNDGRSFELIDRIKSNDPLYRRIKHCVASFIKNGSTLTLIRWLKEHEPEQYQRAAWFFTCKDWIRYRLTGSIAWELSDATCSCVNLLERRYAREIFRELDIAEAEEKMPPLIGAVDRAGGILPELAGEIGLLPGTPVSGGMLDLVSTAAGLGVVDPHDACVIVGTTGMTFTVLNDYTPDDHINGWEVHIDGKSYIKGIGCMAATPNLDWAIASLFPGKSPHEVYEEIALRLAGRAPFASGLLYHPHISAAGERAPFFNAKAAAQLLGIRQTTKPLDILHAVMEGVAFAIKDCLMTVGKVNQVYLSGGGAKSPVWAQILCDVLGADVYITSSGELSAKGAAISAALMTGLFKNMGEVKERFIKIKTVLRPNPANVPVYTGLYQMYKKTQGCMDEFWNWRFEHLRNEA